MCGGVIAERFAVKIGESNGIFGPGSFAAHSTVSAGYACRQCGIIYGLPVFEATAPNEQVEFELSLRQARLKHALVQEDLFVDRSYFAVSIKEDLGISQPQPELPSELAALEAGTIVYVLRGVDDSSSYEPGNNGSCIQLSPKKGSRVFEVNHGCLE